MIIVSFHSQLGNQLFQYAFAVATSRKLNTFFVPYLSIARNPYQLTYFKTDRFTEFICARAGRARLFRRIIRKLIRFLVRNTVKDTDGSKLVPVQKRTYYEGYFQSDSYFKQQLSVIKKAFTIKKHYQDIFKIRYGPLFDTTKVLVLHIRRADYREVEFEGLGGKDVSLPMKYYHAALSEIENLNEYAILVVGDEIDAILGELAEYPALSVEINEPIIDFQLIQHADIAIIANSSFAWWAAYLSKKEDSLIFAPCNWLGHKVKKEYPKGITTERFNWISF